MADFPTLAPVPRVVKLAGVNLADHTFVVSYGFELTPLVDSIRQVGVTLPSTTASAGRWPLAGGLWLQAPAGSRLPGL